MIGFEFGAPTSFCHRDPFEDLGVNSGRDLKNTWQHQDLSPAQEAGSK
jgi:hypothetical protein